MKQRTKSEKILIVLLFWEGDKKQAMRLARLLADLEPEHSEQADFLFVARFDAVHDDSAIRYVSRKFNVYQYTSKRRGVGWPLGCNGVFFGAMEWVFHKMNAAQIPHYKALLILGGDGAPLKRDWLPVFHSAWAAANAEKKTFVAGALIEAGGVEHINGDCMMLSGDLEFLRWLAVTVGDVSSNAGWDWVLPAEFQRWGWCDFPFVRSTWQFPLPFTQEHWDAEMEAGVAWFHGVKGPSLLDLCRKNLLNYGS